MTPGTLVLLHTPFASADAWGDLPEMLRSYGLDVITPDVPDLDGVRYVARTSLIIAATAPDVPLVLVGHGAAGPLLPAIASAQRAAHRPVGAYVFVDASLPRTARATQNHGHDHAHAAEGAQSPSQAHAHALGEASAHANGRVATPNGAVLNAQPFAQPKAGPPAPVPADWPDAPCGYLRTHADRTAAPSGADAVSHDQAVREASLRGWTVVQHEPPAAVAQALSELIATL
ncbi:hypothetical protein DZF91_13265 [Actinomadura logoneensis]|uniref:Alpha/beta hydrolase n=1 Tax=Actinomadura logoneensis TaxID=2293572 RepID=A0A372JMC1_9ACTN|nr:hypothetical protein [Actinomadura logoneensis]RFU41173.1 hypothetical protein DZF91_13265 [Actinomadura logoneensis]